MGGWVDGSRKKENGRRVLSGKCCRFYVWRD